MRVVPPADPANGRPGMVWAETLDGTRRSLGFEEDRISWGWAIIEVLRLIGIRMVIRRDAAVCTSARSVGGEVVPELVEVGW